MPQEIISINKVSRTFETSDVITYALKDVDLTICEGEYVSISGQSGSGKSTLLSILGMLDAPSSGSYLFEGKDVTTLSVDEKAEFRGSRLGIVFQSFHLIDELTVAQNVALPLKYSNAQLSSAEEEARIDQKLAAVGLTHRKNHYPNQLSGGQQQRVAIARALVCDPAILLLDEPTGNLDSANSENVMVLLSQLNDAGTTICLVTHEPNYASSAKRQIVLSDGLVQS